jgi:hypothetical protein
LRFRRLEVQSEPLEHSSRCLSIARANAIQRFGDGRFYGALARGICAAAALGQAKHGAPPIPWIVCTCKESLVDEPLEDASQRAGMHVQDRRKIAGRHSWVQADDTEHQPLRARDAHLSAHVLGRAFQSVHDRPQQLHKLQHVGEACLHRVLSAILECRHDILSSN